MPIFWQRRHGNGWSAVVTFEEQTGAYAYGTQYEPEVSWLGRTMNVLDAQYLADVAIPEHPCTPEDCTAWAEWASPDS